MNSNVIWVLLHLPKTGGTTFNGHMYKSMEWDREFIHLGPWGDFYRSTKGKMPFEKRSVKEREMAQVLAGHETYFGIHQLVPNKNPRYITFVRDPVSRLESLYNFEMTHMQMRSGKVISFDEWYSSRSRNEMVEFYVSKSLEYTGHGIEKAMSTLDRCWFVGITEKLNRDIGFLFSKIGVPPVWKNYRVTGDANSALHDLKHPDVTVPRKYLSLDNRIKQMIYDENEEDVALYRYALKHNESWKRKRMDIKPS